MNKKTIIVIIISAFIVLSLIAIGIYIYYTRFSISTMVNGIDCSLLDVNQAKETILNAKDEKITFLVKQPDGTLKEYNILTSKVGFKINDTALKNELDKQKKEENKKELEVSNLFTINTKDVGKCIKFIEINEKEKEVASKNAYVDLNSENYVEIIPEKIRNRIRF